MELVMSQVSLPSQPVPGTAGKFRLRKEVEACRVLLPSRVYRLVVRYAQQREIPWRDGLYLRDALIPSIGDDAPVAEDEVSRATEGTQLAVLKLIFAGTPRAEGKELVLGRHRQMYPPERNDYFIARPHRDEQGTSDLRGALPLEVDKT